MSPIVTSCAPPVPSTSHNALRATSAESGPREWAGTSAGRQDSAQTFTYEQADSCGLRPAPGVGEKAEQGEGGKD